MIDNQLDLKHVSATPSGIILLQDKKYASVVIGNGKSRLKYNLDELRDVGTTFGCNALYRDWSPDYLVTIDPWMVAEIMDSKYPQGNDCYIRGVNPIPAHMHGIMKPEFENCTQNVVDDFDPTIHDQFMVLGVYDEITKDTAYSTTYMVGINENYDQIHDPREVGCDIVEGDQFATYEFAGTLALDIACKYTNEKIYLVGFDFSDGGDIINNVYKNTTNYYTDQDGENKKLEMSYREIAEICNRHPHIQFLNINTGPVPDTLKTVTNYRHIDSKQLFKEKG